MTQNNLGNALATLGERESGTARLEEAVAAYRAALEERTRERVPLDWAMTQNNLGNALATLGERESGTARLEEAVAAYRAALEERTRERVPLDWAMTQNNLGNALATLGERESGTARLEEAVAAYRAALEERTRERVPLDWAHDAEEPRHRACDAGRARERDGAAGGGGGSLSRGCWKYSPMPEQNITPMFVAIIWTKRWHFWPRGRSRACLEFLPLQVAQLGVSGKFRIRVYAAGGINTFMPRSGLCRVGATSHYRTPLFWGSARHNGGWPQAPGVWLRRGSERHTRHRR